MLVVFLLLNLTCSLGYQPQSQSSRCEFALKLSSGIPSLSSNCLWNLDIALQSKDIKSTTLIGVRFVEDRGYEPPQGKIFVETDPNSFMKLTGKGYAGSWSLSEDKNDRKDGLWIWGLFKEPKYPYLYFTLGLRLVS
jgi:hypothetical protein